MTVTLCLSCSPDVGVHSIRVQMAPLAWCGFPYHISSISVWSLTQLPPWASNSTGTRIQFNYIIVRCPLDLWNRMFNRHQAEITVMQFRGHSLPVHHSVVYHGNYLVPFHQPISAHAISSPNCHWNVSLPSGASPWNSIFFGPGRRSKHNMHISFCNTLTFPIKHVTASAYLHGCILFREISDWWISQGSISNTTFVLVLIFLFLSWTKLSIS